MPHSVFDEDLSRIICEYMGLGNSPLHYRKPLIIAACDKSNTMAVSHARKVALSCQMALCFPSATYILLKRHPLYISPNRTSEATYDYLHAASLAVRQVL